MREDEIAHEMHDNPLHWAEKYAKLQADLSVYKEIAQFSHDKWFAFHNPDAIKEVE